MRVFRTGILLLLIGMSLQSSAQQIPQYSQYLFNHFIVNPAVVGSQECLRLHFSHRRQWVGFSGAPITSYVTVQARLKSKKRGIIRGHHGVGLTAENDDAGPFGKTAVNLAYAYHLKLRRSGLTLSSGIAAGFQQFRVSAGEIRVGDPTDPIIGNAGNAFLVPDLRPGMWLYSDTYYAGVSIHQFGRNRIRSLGSESRLDHHYAISAGKKFTAKDEISLIPSVLLKLAPFSAPAIDINLLVDVRNQITFGLGYRNTDAVVGLVKFNFLQYMSLGYSFDFTTSRLRLASSNSHEITLAIRTCPRGDGNRTTNCPAYQ